jgi:hypothetical protein
LQVELVKSWRREWGQDMTFIIAQLANHRKDTKVLIREAQMQGARMVSNAGLAVNIDIGHATNIHPGNKQDVGLRMGLAARAIAYRQSIHHSGPLYSRMEVEGSAIRLFFKHAEGGLLLKGAGNDTTFQVAGADGRFVRGTAVVDKDTTLLVSAASVTSPTAVRYAFTFNPEVTLYSKALPNLPASPFRTNGPAFEEVPTAVGRDASAPPVASTPAFAFQARRGSSGNISLVYTLSRAARVSLDLFDVRGRKWSAATGGLKAAGSHSREVNLREGLDGRGLAGEGLYLARLRVDGQERVLPVIFEK